MMLSRPGFIFAAFLLAAVPAHAASSTAGEPHTLTCFTRVAVTPPAGPQTRIIPAVYEKQRVEIATEAGVPEWKRSDNRRLSAVFRVDPHDGGIWYLVPGPARRQVVERDVVIVPERIETIPAAPATEREVPVLCAAELTSGRIRDIETALIARGFLRGAPGGVWSTRTQAGFVGFQRANGIVDVDLVTIEGLVKLGLMNAAAPAPVKAPAAPAVAAVTPVPAVPEVKTTAGADERVRRYSVQREIILPQ